jgi:hypothetical protein
VDRYTSNAQIKTPLAFNFTKALATGDRSCYLNSASRDKPASPGIYCTTNEQRREL